jgi:pyrroline-5-carboxylate reductase
MGEWERKTRFFSPPLPLIMQSEKSLVQLSYQKLKIVEGGTMNPDLKLGIIGIGNMGGTILRGILSKRLVEPQGIFISGVDKAKLQSISNELKVNVAYDNVDLVKSSDLIIYCAKPQNVEQILPEVASHLLYPRWLISVAAGVKTAKIESFLSNRMAIVRVMPNIASIVGEGITAICGGNSAKKEHLEMAEEIFQTMGKTLRLDEKHMDAVTGLSASGLAFVFLMMEAMIDAGVHLGLSRSESSLLTMQTFLGASKLALESGEHPAILKNRVTSPGGTTNAGLYELERQNLRATLMSGVIAATKRSEELGK